MSVPGVPKLVALLDGNQVGTVLQRADGRLAFRYDEAWQGDSDAYALSPSMPLTSTDHAHTAISTYLWGLLPDNSAVLDGYGRRFGVSSRNPVALLAHIGIDCIGAVQFAHPDQAANLVGHARPRSGVDWLTEAGVAAELKNAKRPASAGPRTPTTGQFSLPGAQAKIALYRNGEQWGIPRGRTPTNCILKPPSRDFPGFAENEHFCLDLAHELGLGAARSHVRQFDDEIAIVVERFDRRTIGRELHRVHQVDICQALAVHPDQKYENEGGPGAKAIITLLRGLSQQPATDIDRFVDAMVLNWVIGGTDAHAKNYALLLGAHGAVRLSPFYDMESVLPYADAELRKIKLAMKVGGEYLISRMAARHWQTFAKENGIPVDALLSRVAGLLDHLPAAIGEVERRAIAGGLDAAVIRSLARKIRARAKVCAAMF